MKRQNYKCLWNSQSLVTVANISFSETSDGKAIATARNEARLMGLPNTRFTLYRGAVLIHDGI